RNRPATRSSASSESGETSKNPWKCPHCPFIQHSRRSPDYKRHVATHGQPETLWTCRGVPLLRANDPKHTRTPVPLEEVWAARERGEEMVGGCGKTFSRKDAFARHLRNPHLWCAGRSPVEGWHQVDGGEAH
ncbi:uncharacterized protein BXZ73DRAFT_49215, partial [Epithele typhae]|uniref:uncharacterized protein n=1 Tax=Epithele typhae TaxID=378194 RepID=UPI00200778EF